MPPSPTGASPPSPTATTHRRSSRGRRDSCRGSDAQQRKSRPTSIPTGAASISTNTSIPDLLSEVEATEEAQHVKKLIQDYFASFIKVGDKD
ncbi:hypothetical protein KY289_016951 [Solanum tuberosum]|nr:hypothetical protein KY284_016741 [Solanum tuberosum]KAH0689593.1 hypothetical protein KY289_016951 [Solanum tuberosum]